MEQTLSEQLEQPKVATRGLGSLFIAKQQLLSKVHGKHSCGCCNTRNEMEILMDNINLDKVKDGFILSDFQFEYLIDKLKSIQNSIHGESLKLELYPKSNRIVATLKGPLEFTHKPGYSFVFDVCGIVTTGITEIHISHQELADIIDFHDTVKEKVKYILWKLSGINTMDPWIHIKTYYKRTHIKKGVPIGHSRQSKHLEPHVANEGETFIGESIAYHE